MQMHFDADKVAQLLRSKKTARNWSGFHPKDNHRGLVIGTAILFDDSGIAIPAMKDYEEWLAIVKDGAFRAGIPLRAELLNLVYQTTGELGSEAEAESLGLTTSRIHPDIYMNELLVGMRVIHQVLPGILKKLGIDDEFKLDTSELPLD